MGTQGPGRKRIPNRDKQAAEDDALSQIARENLSTCNVTFYLKSIVLPISQIVHSPLQMSPQFWTWFGHSRTLNHYGIDL
ncbi:hypothetical protein XENOCAPTIV_024001 [Xenoophorus captivus]|uniref:Uncharacterized protein n=1 Tax=Xenoophorus captivus TaxID=1517983 RepID=A0ABV0QTA2_9TELE